MYRFQINDKRPLVSMASIHYWKEKRMRYFYLFLMMLGLPMGALYITYDLYQSPKEYILQQENEAYQKQLEQINSKIDSMESSLTRVVGYDDSIYRVVYEAEPIPIEQRQVGYGGADRYNDLKGYSNSDEIIAASAKLDRLGRQMYIELKSLNEVSRIANNNAKMLASIPAIQPVSINDYRYISSPFGYRDHPKSGRWKKHEGIDIVAPYGSPVYATGDGMIEYLRSSMHGYGKVIIINHSFGYETLYAHMSKLAVNPGDKVKRGQLIGYVGNTGISTGTHLHYEVIKNGRHLNPRKFYFNDISVWEYQSIVRNANK